MDSGIDLIFTMSNFYDCTDDNCNIGTTRGCVTTTAIMKTILTPFLKTHLKQMKQRRQHSSRIRIAHFPSSGGGGEGGGGGGVKK